LHWIARAAALQPELVVVRGLGDAAAQIAALRCFLHYRADRDLNTLDLEAHEAFAERVTGRDHFQNAREVFFEARRTLEKVEKNEASLLDQAHAAESRVSNGEFTVLHGKILLRRPAEFAQDPAAVFRLLEFMARHGAPAAPETEGRLNGVHNLLAEYCAGTRNLWTATLHSIFDLPHCAAALRLVRDAGLLSAIFPELAEMEGTVVEDPDLKFTLDEHALRAIEHLDELRAASNSSRQRFSQLYSEIDDLALLRLALLFQAASRENGGNWPLASAALAGKAAYRMQMPARDEETVEFLIENQLVLGEASSRDLDDRATAHQLAETMGTIERAKMLAVFRYADVAATYTAETAERRLEQLRQTEALMERILTRELETERITDLPPTLPATAEFIKGFPLRYLRARTVQEIEDHAKLYELSRDSGVAVDLTKIPGAYRLTVVARDVPFLFASFAGAISSFGLDILKAEAFANSRGVVLDTFEVADPKRTLELNPPEADRLQDLIRRIAQGKTDARRLLRNRERPDPSKRSFAPEVRFDSEACETATLVEIVAEDRPGLLYSLATAISSSGGNIDLVLIDTKGRRAIDVFYVAREGRKLSAEEQRQLRDELLAVC
jgi:[protein-PII] uridylyltransferase